MDTVVDRFYQVLVDQAREGLAKRNIDSTYVPTLAEASDVVLASMITPATVLSGGSQTVRRSGLLERLQKTEGIRYLNPEIRQYADPEARNNFRRWAGTADYFIGGVNALVTDGRIVNIDGGGSRMSSYAFAAKRVIMVMGVNKICKSLDQAMYRTREWAGVMTAMEHRETRHSPCVDDGICHEERCFPPHRECGKWLIIEKETIAHRIHVIIVGEQLGH